MVLLMIVYNVLYIVYIYKDLSKERYNTHAKSIWRLQTNLHCMQFNRAMQTL